MKDVPDSRALLEAFAAFTEASEQLQQKYGALEGRLARLQNELETVLDVVPIGIWVLGAQGELRFTNRPQGLDGSFLEGPAPWEPGAPSGLRQFRGHDGTDRCFEEERRPTEAGQVILLRDVTETRLQAQQDSREARLQAMGLMAAELAHEIRNPLGGLTLFAGMLAQDLADRPEQLDLVTRIQEGVQRLNVLVGNTLTFSRDLNPTPERIPLASFWDELFSTQHAPSNLAWSNGVPTHAAWQADPGLLRQVGANLLQNALRALEDRPQPRLHLHAALEQVDGVRHWRLVLEDNGCGIPSEALPRVFDPFYTTFQGGTGLGLAVCHRILLSHGGLLYLESSEDIGTKVHLRLPAA